MFTGIFWTGKKAKKLGLIDGIGAIQDILMEKFGDNVKIKQITQKKGLFINPVYTSHIQGFNEEESFLLLSKLYEHMTQKKYIYRHKWKENMLLMWDNRTVMHMAEGGYDGYDRLLHRITIANS